MPNEEMNQSPQNQLRGPSNNPMQSGNPSDSPKTGPNLPGNKKKGRGGLLGAAAGAAKAGGQMALHAGKAILSFLGSAVGIGVVGVASTLTFLTVRHIAPVDSNKTSLEYPVTNSNYETAQVLGDVFYQRFSDQSFYFTLSEPDDEAKREELEKYSGKAYKEHDEISHDATFPDHPLDGEKDKG